MKTNYLLTGTATMQRLKNVHLLTDILISLLPAFSLFTEDVTKQLQWLAIPNFWLLSLGICLVLSRAQSTIISFLQRKDQKRNRKAYVQLSKTVISLYILEWQLQEAHRSFSILNTTSKKAGYYIILSRLTL